MRKFSIAVEKKDMQNLHRNQNYDLNKNKRMTVKCTSVWGLVYLGYSVTLLYVYSVFD